MSLTASSYFIFLSIALLLYYTIGRRVQMYIMLVASLLFFSLASGVYVSAFLPLLGLIIAITWYGALLIERTEGGYRKCLMVICVMLLTMGLIIFKYAYHLTELFMRIIHCDADISWLMLTAPIGISYFTLTAIGYLAEVYWGNLAAEKNPAVTALCICWFPQIVSGPVTRFATMKKQFTNKHHPDPDKFTAGMFRMLWGYYKKTLIADRFAVVVHTVFNNYLSFGSDALFIATLCYAIQLYADFSGCMDIVIGTSTLFGITLPENFNVPFASLSVREFWLRWHITLGTWFKDYIMYPIQISEPFVAMNRFFRKHFGKKTGKKLARKVPFYISMLILWFLIGIWHGATAYYFIASAAIPCFLLMAGDLLQPIFAAVVRVLRVPTNHPAWHMFQRLRTLLLICTCWVFVCAGSVGSGAKVLGKILTFSGGTAFLSAQAMGFSMIDLFVMFSGAIFLMISDVLQYRNVSVSRVIAGFPFALRYLLLYATALIVILGGVGGSGFIYFQF